MKRPVLIVIDMLRDSIDGWEQSRIEILVQRINELIGIVRGLGSPVIWVRQEFEPDLRDAFPEMRAKGIRVAIKGTPGSEILPELARIPSDIVVVKKRYSAFYRTNLDEILAELAPDVIILAGVNTHACIRTAAIDAYQRDWPVILAEDCVDSYDREHHEISLRYMRDRIAKVMSNEELTRLSVSA
jgi:bifunctional isochorismate lyase/aryl carrier protein